MAKKLPAFLKKKMAGTKKSGRKTPMPSSKMPAALRAYWAKKQKG